VHIYNCNLVLELTTFSRLLHFFNIPVPTGSEPGRDGFERRGDARLQRRVARGVHGVVVLRATAVRAAIASTGGRGTRERAVDRGMQVAHKCDWFFVCWLVSRVHGRATQGQQMKKEKKKS
jgi:hypothetical protein